MIMFYRLGKPLQKSLIYLKVSHVHTRQNVAPLKRYSEMLEKGILKPDKHQFSAVLKLQDVYNDLKEYHIKPAKPNSNSANDANNSIPKGFYLHGGVGTGKTLLLDLFYDSIPTTQKKRVHFNAFMLYLYSEINRWNLCCEDNVEMVTPTEHIANKIMEDTWLLCFDEVQLSDYASCTLLDGIFSHMISKGAVIFGTSNRSPLELGDVSITDNFDGETSSVQESLSSFKSLFMDKCHVHYLESERDHREEMKRGQNRYFNPFTVENEEKLDQLFAKLIPHGEKITSSTVEIYGRKVLIPLSVANIARFSFNELCCQPLGPADYLKICNTFSTVFIDNIPKMTIQQKNEARRLLSFIDAAYECRVKIFCTAEALPEELFLMLPRDNDDYELEQMHMEMMGEIAYDLQIHGMDFKSLNIISGEDEIFSFKRAISRMKEMQSLFYQTTEHRQQTFIPYVGSIEEREKAGDRRVQRERKRQSLLEKQEEENVDDQALHGSFSKDVYKREYTDTDWGDEASYITVSKEADKILSKQKTNYNNRQKEAPKFGEQHFWGFGWWEHVKNKIKGPKGPKK